MLGPEKAQETKRGEIVEVYAGDPEKMELYASRVLFERGGEIALLGAHGHFVAGAPQGTLIMPAQSAAQMLYAASELIKSQAIETIVMQDLFLRSDYSREIVAELKKLRVQVRSSNVTLVLLNPDTSERKMILSELQTICSRQISL